MPINTALPAELQTDQELATAWAAFNTSYQRLVATIATNLAASAQVFHIVLEDGTVMGDVIASDYAYRFPLLDWGVASSVPQNGGVGATESHFNGNTWVGATTRILPDGVKGFARWGDKGLTYLALHETAHTTPLGVAVNQQCWDLYQNSQPVGPYDMSNQYWIRNEKTANNVARAVAQQLGLETFPEANPGYILEVGRPTLFQALDMLDHTTIRLPDPIDISPPGG